MNLISKGTVLKAIPLSLNAKRQELREPPKTWHALLTQTPPISPLIIRHMLDPLTLGSLAVVSRRFRRIVTAEWRLIQNPASNEFIAKRQVKLIMKHFIEGDLKISQEEFFRTTTAPLLPERRKLFFLSLVCDDLVKPLTNTFTVEENVAMVRFIRSRVGRSIAQKAIDFERFEKNMDPAIDQVFKVLKENALSLTKNAVFGASAAPLEPFSKDRVIKKNTKKDVISVMPQPLLIRLIVNGMLHPKAVTRLAGTSRYFRFLVNRSWRHMKHPACLQFVVGRKLELVLQNLGLEEFLKEAMVMILQQQKGVVGTVVGKPLGFVVSKIPTSYWKHLIGVLSKVILPHLTQIIPFTMEESIGMIYFAQSKPGQSAIRKMISFGIAVDKIAYSCFCALKIEDQSIFKDK